MKARRSSPVETGRRGMVEAENGLLQFGHLCNRLVMVTRTAPGRRLEALSRSCSRRWSRRRSGAGQMGVQLVPWRGD